MTNLEAHQAYSLTGGKEILTLSPSTLIIQYIGYLKNEHTQEKSMTYDEEEFCRIILLRVPILFYVRNGIIQPPSDSVLAMMYVLVNDNKNV